MQPDVNLEFAFEAAVTVGAPASLGDVGRGVRRIIPITGGVVEGPALNGVVLPGGADWQIVHPNGMVEIEARYTLQADDGALIYVHNPGIREASPEVVARLNAGEMVDPTLYYFRSTPRLETGSAQYGWMNRRLFVCAGVRQPDRVLLRFYKIT